jgi:hypothetical protein
MNAAFMLLKRHERGIHVVSRRRELRKGGGDGAGEAQGLKAAAVLFRNDQARESAGEPGALHYQSY